MVLEEDRSVHPWCLGGMWSFSSLDVSALEIPLSQRRAQNPLQLACVGALCWLVGCYMAAVSEVVGSSEAALSPRVHPFSLAVWFQSCDWSFVD